MISGYRRLTLWNSLGEYQVQVWEPYTRTDDIGPWIEVIDATRGAGGLVPWEFVAVWGRFHLKKTIP